MKQQLSFLNGWVISPPTPFYEFWHAQRFGVAMHTNTYEGIIRMIRNWEPWYKNLIK